MIGKLIVIIVIIALVLAYFSIPIFLDVNVKIGSKEEETFFTEPDEDGFYINETDITNQSIILMDENGTVLFEGSMGNETMWNTSLNLNMTFRDFVGLMTPYSFDYDMHGIIIQVANQLNEV